MGCMGPFLSCNGCLRGWKFGPMPKANRLRGDGGVFHLTQRCHNRAFLLKFARDRNAYRTRLHEQLFQYDLSGQPKRYRLLDLERLCWRLGTDDLVVVRKNLEASLEEALARESVRREPCWTESLALGSAGFVERIQPMILSRQETEVVEAADGVWVLREAPAHYGKETGTESEPKHSF